MSYLIIGKSCIIFFMPLPPPPWIVNFGDIYIWILQGFVPQKPHQKETDRLEPEHLRFLGISVYFLPWRRPTEVVGCFSSSAQWWFGSTFSRHVWEPEGGSLRAWSVGGSHGWKKFGVIGCVWKPKHQLFFSQKIPKVYDIHQPCGWWGLFQILKVISTMFGIHQGTNHHDGVPKPVHFFFHWALTAPKSPDDSYSN